MNFQNSECSSEHFSEKVIEIYCNVYFILRIFQLCCTIGQNWQKYLSRSGGTKCSYGKLCGISVKWDKLFKILFHLTDIPPLAQRKISPSQAQPPHEHKVQNIKGKH